MSNLLKEYIKHLFFEARKKRPPTPEEIAAKEAEKLRKEKEKLEKLERALESKGWIKWPEDVLDIPYKEGRPGVGPGEDRLAKILNGRVQGGSVSYDIITSDGKKWEVKEPDKGMAIRPGTEGAAAVSDEVFKITDVSKQIQFVYNHLLSLGKLESVFSSELIDKIESYINNDIPMIDKKEITSERFQNLFDIVKEISEIYKEGKEEEKEKSVELKSKEKKSEKKVSLKQFAKIASVAGFDKDEIGITDEELVSGNFSSEAFMNPEKWAEDVWEPAAWPSEVFSLTDGVILVSPTHYRVIDKSDLNTSLKFKGISQGTARFKVV